MAWRPDSSVAAPSASEGMVIPYDHAATFELTGRPGNIVQGVINVGTGKSVSLLALIDALGRCAGCDPQVRFEAPVPGDIRDSAMRPERMRDVLGFVPATGLEDGLAHLLAYPG